MKNFFFSIGIALLTLPTAAAADNLLGYTDGSCIRDNMFHVGTAKSQGLAIRISGEKLKNLKGCSITSISATFGSSRTTDGNVTLFIGTSPAAPAVEESQKITRALQWNDFKLSTPYVITGEEEELYIGYRGEIASTANMLMHDGNRVIPGTCFALNGSEWVDLDDLGFGCANIRFNIEGAPEIADAIIKPINTDSYYKAETPYSFEGQLFNFGLKPISSFDLVVSIGDNTPAVKHYEGLDIAPASNFNFLLDSYSSAYEGIQPMSLEVKNVNGGGDLDDSDNSFAGNLCFYPKDMERAILIEGFTGQACSNCPEGHLQTSRWMETLPEGTAIEVMHHSGYQPDYMSMDADFDYTFFFGKTSTYAPAVMMNRTLFPSIGSYPTWGPSVNTFEKAHEIVKQTQPYVSLSLNSTFDPETRETKISFRTLAHNDLPAETNVFNLFLVQDGIVENQTGGGSNYIHNAVFRGTLTGNSWGKMLPSRGCVTGGVYEWEYTFTLPEAIFSDYWASFNQTENAKKRSTIAVVPENMKIVAYVGALGGDDISGHTIYNAIEVKLGENHQQGGMTAVENIAAPTLEADVFVSGRRLVVSGNCDRVELFNLRGLSIDTTGTLAPGFYIARLSKDGKQTVKKLIVK